MINSETYLYKREESAKRRNWNTSAAKSVSKHQTKRTNMNRRDDNEFPKGSHTPQTLGLCLSLFVGHTVKGSPVRSLRMRALGGALQKLAIQCQICVQIRDPSENAGSNDRAS